MKTIIHLLFFVFPFVLCAQQNAVSAGGDAVGSGGSASYSVGQIVWHAIPSQDFSIQEGLQQPFEIFVLSVPEQAENVPGIGIYPNPVATGLTLQFEVIPENSDYNLYDVSGRLIRTERINGQETAISMEGFQSGIYILHISKNGKSIQSFKIVKN